MMSWYLGGANCLNRGFPRIMRIAQILASVRKNRQNQDFQEKQQFVKRIQFQHIPL